MSKKKRVGIMGGTFNPIHLGHLILAEHAYEQLELDEVLFVPSGNPYMKEYANVLDIPNDKYEILNRRYLIFILHKKFRSRQSLTASKKSLVRTINMMPRIDSSATD